MKNWILNLWLKLIERVNSLRTPPLPPTSAEPQPERVNIPRASRAEIKKMAREMGQYANAKELLEDTQSLLAKLDELKDLRKSLRTFLGFYGATLTTDDACANVDVPESIIENMPAFLCTAYSNYTKEEHTDDYFYPLFTFIQKTDFKGIKPIDRYTLKAFPGEVFEVLVVYFDGAAPGETAHFSFYAGITTEGDIMAIPTIQEIHLPAGDYTYRQKRLGFPSCATQLFWARQERHKNGPTGDPMDGPPVVDSVEEYLRGTFISTFNLAMRREWGINVTCSTQKSRVVAVIPDDTAKHLFKDRTKVRTKTGVTRRIFHAVAAHTRKTGSNVRTHYRGLRDFMWHGMQVNIGIPGKHFTPLYTFDLSADAALSEGDGYSLGDMAVLLDQTNQHLDPSKLDHKRNIVQAKAIKGMAK